MWARNFSQQIQYCMRNKPASKYPKAKTSRRQAPPPPVTTRHHCGWGAPPTHPPWSPPPPPPKRGPNFLPGLRNQKLSLAPLAPISLDQKISLAPPKNQHHLGGGVQPPNPPTHLKELWGPSCTMNGGRVLGLNRLLAREGHAGTPGLCIVGRGSYVPGAPCRTATPPVLPGSQGPPHPLPPSSIQPRVQVWRRGAGPAGALQGWPSVPRHNGVSALRWGPSEVGCPSSAPAVQTDTPAVQPQCREGGPFEVHKFFLSSLPPPPPSRGPNTKRSPGPGPGPGLLGQGPPPGPGPGRVSGPEAWPGPGSHIGPQPRPRPRPKQAPGPDSGVRPSCLWMVVVLEPEPYGCHWSASPSSAAPMKLPRDAEC